MEEERKREVVWMPAFASAAVTLMVTFVVPLLGSVLTLAAVAVLAVRLPRRQWTPLTWLCLGALIGSAVFWILVGVNATF